MRNDQKKRLEEAIEQYNKKAETPLDWWSVMSMIGDEENRMRVETTIRAIERMAKDRT